MKEKVYNYDNLRDNAINDRVIRVKGVIANSKNEILLAEFLGTMQFPGGHLEGKETLNEALKREIKEETGLVINSDYEPFYAIKYYLKDFPVIGNNRSIEIYYFYIFTDELYRPENFYLDDRERNGDFKLFYVPLKDIKKTLKKSVKNNKINRLINREMMLAIKALKKRGKML